MANDPQQEINDRLLKSATQHLQQHDYEAAVRELEKIPLASRTENVSCQLASAKAARDEVASLRRKIIEDVTNRRFDGLLEKTTRLLDLNPQNPAVEKIHQQLLEREQEALAELAEQPLDATPPDLTKAPSQVPPGLTKTSRKAPPGLTKASSQTPPGLTKPPIQEPPGLTKAPRQATPNSRIESSRQSPNFNIDKTPAQRYDTKRRQGSLVIVATVAALLLVLLGVTALNYLDDQKEIAGGDQGTGSETENNDQEQGEGKAGDKQTDSNPEKPKPAVVANVTPTKPAPPDTLLVPHPQTSNVKVTWHQIATVTKDGRPLEDKSFKVFFPSPADNRWGFRLVNFEQSGRKLDTARGEMEAPGPQQFIQFKNSAGSWTTMAHFKLEGTKLSFQWTGDAPARTERGIAVALQFVGAEQTFRVEMGPQELYAATKKPKPPPAGDVTIKWASKDPTTGSHKLSGTSLGGTTSLGRAKPGSAAASEILLATLQTTAGFDPDELKIHLFGAEGKLNYTQNPNEHNLPVCLIQGTDKNSPPLAAISLSQAEGAKDEYQLTLVWAPKDKLGDNEKELLKKDRLWLEASILKIDHPGLLDKGETSIVSFFERPHSEQPWVFASGVWRNSEYKRVDALGPSPVGMDVLKYRIVSDGKKLQGKLKPAKKEPNKPQAYYVTQPMIGHVAEVSKWLTKGASSQLKNTAISFQFNCSATKSPTDLNSGLYNCVVGYHLKDSDILTNKASVIMAVAKAFNNRIKEENSKFRIDTRKGDPKKGIPDVKVKVFTGNNELSKRLNTDQQTCINLVGKKLYKPFEVHLHFTKKFKNHPEPVRMLTIGKVN